MILFLDFDGVLHPALNDRPVEDFSRRRLLWQILRASPDVEVVFSTSWRNTYPVHELIAFVTADGGEDLAHRFIGTTPTLVREPGAYYSGPAYRREKECRLWVSGNGQQHLPWLAVDDDETEFPSTCSTVYWVDRQKGLTAADVAALSARLKS